MTFGFPAYAEAEELYESFSRGELLDAIEQVLDDLGWRFDYRGPASLEATSSVSFWSWGERIRIEADRDGIVWVRSECRMPTQCLDWGKNRRNVDRFLEGLDAEVRRTRRKRRPARQREEPDEDRIQPARDPGIRRRLSDHTPPPSPPPPPAPRTGP